MLRIPPCSFPDKSYTRMSGGDLHGLEKYSIIAMTLRQQAIHILLRWRERRWSSQLIANTRGKRV